MKPTSVIFLILAAVMIASGLIICGIAENKAEAAGIDLFYESGNEDRVVVRDISDAELVNISINLKNATVNILPSDDDSYIELVNFRVNTYGFNIANNNLTIDDSISLLSILNISEGGFSFKGLRFYKDLNNFKGGDKTINIYLAEGYGLNGLTLTLGKGNLSIGAVADPVRYNITINEGNMTVDGQNNEAEYDILLKKGDAQFVNTVVKKLTAEMNNGNFSMSVPNITLYSYSLTSGMGTVSFDREDKGGLYNATSPVDRMNVTVDTVLGNIDIIPG